VSGLETLPPDQRAVLQLILVQGRGYADLAATLKLDVSAVRDRAHAGADALGLPGGDALDPAQRAHVVDYLLGQQDDGERIVTFAQLGASPAACRWAQALRERLAGLAAGELPELPAPAAAATNGSVAATPPAPRAVAPAPAPTPAAPPSVSAPADTRRPPAARPDAAARPSRLGGAILIAGAAALAIVLAIVLLGGGDDGSPGASTAAGRDAQTQPPASTQGAAGGSTAGNAAASARIVAQVNLTATPSGTRAIGIGLVQQAADGRRAIAIEAQRLPANGPQDIYAVWLQGAAGAKFLGFVPRQVRANGTFTVTAPLPANAAGYSTVLVTREGTTAVPTAPGSAILSGPLRLRG
jgi:hypothetical protein